jgi:hypothetical protein
MTDEQKEVFEKWFEKTCMYVQKNGKVRGTGNQVISVSKIRAKWEAVKGYLDGYFPTDEDDIQGFIDGKVAEMYPETDNTESSPEKLTMQNFMLLWDDTFELRLVSNTPIIFRKGGLYNEQIGLKDSAKEIRVTMVDIGQKPPKVEDATAYVEYIYREFVRDYREKALQNIIYDPNIKQKGFSFKAWTQRLFEFYGFDNTRLNRVMWKYFMHSIKRAAFGKRPCETRIFFLIYSRIQGIGKSRLLTHLCDPFPHAFNNAATLSDFIDKSSIKALTKGAYALVDFQELGMGKGVSGIGRDDFAALMKRIITLDVEKGRELFTTTDTASLMNMVFASSTNLHISDVVQETEYRRYFSFDCTLTKEEAINRDWSEVDDFFRNTLEDAYRFLDENEDPVIPADILAELREVQATYKRRTDIVTLWLREERMEILDEDDSTTTAMDRMALYKMFKRYAVNNGYPSFSSSRMQQLISASLDIMPVEKEDGKSYYFVRRIADAK